MTVRAYRVFFPVYTPYGRRAVSGSGETNGPLENRFRYPVTRYARCVVVLHRMHQNSCMQEGLIVAISQKSGLANNFLRLGVSFSLCCVQALWGKTPKEMSYLSVSEPCCRSFDLVSENSGQRCVENERASNTKKRVCVRGRTQKKRFLRMN